MWKCNMELFVECRYCRWRSRTLYRSAAVYEPSTLCCVWCKCCNSHCGFCLSCLLWISFPVVWPSVLWRCWLGGRKGIRPVKNLRCGAGVVICLERGADLHMARLIPLPLTVSCFSKIQIGFTFLIPAVLGSPGQMAVKWVCVCCMARWCNC